jgi:hypothetical protein
MATTVRTERRSAQVLGILQDINEAIGRSGALSLVGEDASTYTVPRGLRRAVARTALRMIQEGKAAHRMTPEEAEAARAARFAKKAERAKAGKAKRAKAKADREAAGEKPKPQVRFKKKGEYKKRKKSASKAAPSGDDSDAPPPADDGAAPGQTLEREPSLADKIKALKGTRKSRRKTPARGDYSGTSLKSEKGREKIAGLFKKRVKKGKTSRKGRVSTRSHDPAPSRRGRMPLPPGEVPGRHQDEFSWDDKERKWGGHDWRQDEKAKDLDALEKDRRERGLGRGRRGAPGYEPAALRAKVSKLRRERMKHPAFRHPGEDDKSGEDRDLDKDVAKGYFAKRDKEGVTHEHPTWAGHHVDSSGETVHSSGKKDNKKFANATTFGASDDDAMLHTDKSKEGSRASAGDDEFAKVGDTDEDPRNKWFRVSKEGGYASAMASLGKSYHKDKTMRAKVMSKVKQTGFTDSSGHQIDVKPTGSLHNERGACVKRPAVYKDGKKVREGGLTAVGKALKARNPHEFYRLCKGSHDGPGGTAKGRSEYGSSSGEGENAVHKPRGFNPQHDDAAKLRQLHKAAELGKGAPPRGAGGRGSEGGDTRQKRRDDLETRVRATGRQATQTKWNLRKSSGRGRQAAERQASEKRARKAKWRRRGA